MIKNILILALVTFLPLFELRASIPLGILSGTVDLPLGISISGMGLPWWYVFIVCVAVNILIGPVVYLGLYYLTDYFIRYRWFSKPYTYFVNKSQKKIQSYVDKYG